MIKPRSKGRSKAKNAKKRDYKKEYREYHGKPEQIEKRDQRNKARRMMGLEVGDMEDEFVRVWRKQSKRLQRANKKLVEAYEEMLIAAEISRDKVDGVGGIDPDIKKELLAGLDQVAEGALEGLTALASTPKEADKFARRRAMVDKVLAAAGHQ
jgi:hypothetical protein